MNQFMQESYNVGRLFLWLNLFGFLCFRCSNLRRVDFRRKSQRTQGLADMLLHWTDIDKHECLAIASKTVLQEIGKLRISIWDMGLVISKSIDHVCQARQALVYRLRLFESVPGSMTMVESLTTRKIN